MTLTAQAAAQWRFRRAAGAEWRSEDGHYLITPSDDGQFWIYHSPAANGLWYFAHGIPQKAACLCEAKAIVARHRKLMRAKTHHGG